MIEVIRDREIALLKTSGTSLKDHLSPVGYWDLKAVLGEPTFTEESGDGKIQKEWVVMHKGNVFTIYDWKTYDERYTVESLDRWNIGGNCYAGYFLEELVEMIDAGKVAREY